MKLDHLSGLINNHLPLLQIVLGQFSPLLAELVVEGKLTAEEALNEIGDRLVERRGEKEER